MIYLDNNTFQQEIFIPRSSVKNDASPEYATKNELENAIENEVIRADEKYAAKTDLLPYATTGWVESQDFATKEWTDGQIQSAIASETGRTEETYQKKSEMGIYSTTNEVENMIDDAVSGKMDTSAMSAYTKTEDFATINGSAITEGGNIVIEGGGSDYSAGSNINIDENNVISVTGISVPTKVSELVNDEGYITTADTQNFVTSGDVQTQINDSISGKADSSAVTAQINEVKQEIEAKIPSKVSDLQNDLNFASTGDVESMISGFTTSADVKTQIEGYNYINSGQAQTQIDNSISGKLNTDIFTAYTANTQTELNNKQDISGMTEYATTAFTESTYLKEHQSLSAYSTTEQVQTLINTAKQEVENEIPDVSDFVTSAQVETQITDKGYITGYTETDPVFMASPASGITSQDITNWNSKLDASSLDQYYTSAQTDTAINNAVSGKADLSAVTAQISEVKQEIEAEIPSKISSLENDLNFVNSGDVKTQVESYNYINSGQAQTQIDNSISGKLNTDIFTTYTANTQIELNNKQDASGMTEYATTAFTENTYAKIGDIPTKTSDLTNDSGFITNAALSGYATEQYVDNSVSGKVDNSALTQYYTSAQTDTAISNAVSGKLDTSAITAYSTTEEVENMITAATYGLASEEWVNNQGFLKEHQDISGKLDTSDFTAYTANTQTEIDNKQDASAMTTYYTSAQTDTAIQNATNGLASEEWVESQGYLTGYTETDPVFMSSPASGITSQDIINWNNKLDSSDLEPYYTSAQTDNAISNAVSGKADLSAVTAQISAVKQEIEAEIPTKVSELQNDLNFVNSGDVKTQVESYNYINSGQAQTQIDNSISGKLNTDIFTAYTANTQTELNNKQDVSGMTEYATTAFTESTYLKEHQSLSAYTPTSGFSTINGSAITEGGNIVVEETPYSGGTNIDITDHIISVTGITVPTKLSDLTNDSGYINSEQAQTQIDNSVSGKVDTDIFTAYTANTKTEINNAVSGKVDSSRVDEIEEVTASALVELHNTKQDILVSGTNIKTINNESILGSGNIVIQGGSGGESYSAGANIDITNNVISVTGITIPTSNTAFTNDAGFVNSGEVETQITSKGYITGYTETDPVFQASAASGITEQDITNWNNKLDSSALNPYYTSAQTDTAISNAVSGKQDTLVSGTNIKTINNQSLLGSGNIEIQGGSGGGSNIIELTQAEYDALTAYTEDAIYVITDSQAINMDNYVTTGALSSYATEQYVDNAISGKTDKVSVTANDSEFKFPTWNNQGCITGTSATAYQASQSINGSSRYLYSTSSSSLPTIYAPTSAGSAGQPLLSNGGGAPVWGSYKFQFISQSEYDALATKDSTTIYFIVN